MKKININSFCYIKYMHGMYMLVDRKTEKVMAIGFCLEQLASELIRHYNNYLSNSDEIDLIDLIEVIKELKEEINQK